MKWKYTKKPLIIAGVLLILILLLNAGQIMTAHFAPSPQPDDKFFEMIDKPANIAHRGASGDYPENTILAFERALEQDAHALELDLWLTKDKEPVAIHDETVNRTTDGQGKVADFTLEETQDLDASYGLDRNEAHESIDDNVYIPTLDEVLSQFPDTPIVLDVKQEGETAAKKIAEVVSQHDAEDRVVLAGFDTDTVQLLRDKLPEASSAAGTREVIKFHLLSHLGIAGWIDWDFDALFVPHEYYHIPVLTYPFRKAAEASGTYQMIWTINQEELMTDLLNKGVQGILTDYPEVLNEIIEEK